MSPLIGDTDLILLDLFTGSLQQQRTMFLFRDEVHAVRLIDWLYHFGGSRPSDCYTALQIHKHLVDEFPLTIQLIESQDV